MKQIIAFCVAWSAFVALYVVTAAPPDENIPDLGVITERVGIALEPCRSRKDHVFFVVEATSGTNTISFTTTNEVLKIEDFLALPPGPAILGLRSLCGDGAESPLSLFRLDLRRDEPDAPKARRVILGAPRPRGPTLSETLEQRRRTRKGATVLPPGPSVADSRSITFRGQMVDFTNIITFGMTNADLHLISIDGPPTATNGQTVKIRRVDNGFEWLNESPLTLPNGTNESYSRFQERIREAQEKGLRRNE